MKQTKKLTRSQKEKLRKNCLDWNNYMLLSEDKDTFNVIAKKESDDGTREQLIFSK